MELDELKNSWEKIGEQHGKFSQQELKNILRNESQSPFVKIRKSMMKEIALFGAISIFTYIIAFNHSWFAMTLLSFVYIVFLAFCSKFFITIYKKTKQFQLSNTIATELEAQIQSLSSDLRYYRNLNLLFYFPAVFVGFITGNKAIQNVNDLFNSEYGFWVFAGIALLLAFPFYYGLVNYVIKFFYGRYLEDLKAIQKELKSFE